MVKIEKLTKDLFKITVSGTVATQHEVNVTDFAYSHLTSRRATKEELLEFLFKFLLNRKPNTSIFSNFDITVISKYFPEYESELLQILS
jgi:hypothetical protein